jgi:hypothetical protein
MGNEIFGSAKFGEYLGQQNDCEFVKKYPWK